MLLIQATTPTGAPPAWAILERALIDTLNASVAAFLDKYTRPDGSLIFGDSPGGSEDDFYEAYYNWPLLYLLGGGDHLLRMADRGWEGVTRQLTEYGLVKNEYARRDDQFHQGESDLFFYLLCLADPDNPVYTDRARRFAGLYLNETPGVNNYDPVHWIIRCPYDGSDPPRMSMYGDAMPSYGWSPGMARYGLPFYDIPGIASIEDLRNPFNARRMGEAMERRMSRGDIAPNLAVTSLALNAFLMTGDEKYRRWILDYTDAWMERARHNDGLTPDNVGLSGQVGEYCDGKWHGGLYGWTWPHGFYNLQMAVQLAATNAVLLTGDEGYFEWPRRQMDRILERGEIRNIGVEPMSLREHWIGQFQALGDREEAFLTPYRYGDAGWFDYQPLSPIYPVSLWNISLDAGDWRRIERLREAETYDWAQTFSFHTKEDAGHEQPWIQYLSGVYPSYPEDMLRVSLQSVHRRLDLIRSDEEAATHRDVHRWQQVNPVTTEALMQLTLGAPQLIYNGGLPVAPLRYFDGEARRPGLPPDVAALVEKIDTDGITLRLVNLSAQDTRRVIIQAGGFGENRFTGVSYTALASEYPGPISAYAAPAVRSATERAPVEDSRLAVLMPPGKDITLSLGVRRFVHTPSGKTAY